MLGTVLLTIIIVGVVFIGVASMSNNESDKENDYINRYFEELKRSCKDADITFVEPSYRQSYANYKYTYIFQNEVVVENGSSKISPAYYWVDSQKNKLCFVGTQKALTIPLEKIEMYTKDGSVSYISKVKNTGKDISLSGAVVGGIIAGSAGMAVGATKDRHHIDTEVEQVDERVVYICLLYTSDAADE